MFLVFVKIPSSSTFIGIEGPKVWERGVFRNVRLGTKEEDYSALNTSRKQKIKKKTYCQLLVIYTV